MEEFSLRNWKDLSVENQKLTKKLKATNEHIDELYYYDGLTKLPNRKK